MTAQKLFLAGLRDQKGIRIDIGYCVQVSTHCTIILYTFIYVYPSLQNNLFYKNRIPDPKHIKDYITVKSHTWLINVS